MGEHDGSRVEAQGASDTAFVHAVFGDNGKPGQASSRCSPKAPAGALTRAQTPGALDSRLSLFPPIPKETDTFGSSPEPLDKDRRGRQRQEGEVISLMPYFALHQQVIKDGAVILGRGIQARDFTEERIEEIEIALGSEVGLPPGRLARPALRARTYYSPPDIPGRLRGRGPRRGWRPHRRLPKPVGSPGPPRPKTRSRRGWN